MSTIDAQRYAAVRKLYDLGFVWVRGEWTDSSATPDDLHVMVPLDMKYALAEASAALSVSADGHPPSVATMSALAQKCRDAYKQFP